MSATPLPVGLPYRLLGLLLAVGALILAAGAVPAQAASKTVVDPVGDAPSRALDITSVRYTNNDTSVEYTWHLRAVTSATRLIAWSTDACCTDTSQFRVARINGTPTVRVFHGEGDVGWTRRSCRGARVAWRPARHLVHIRIPKLCIIGPADIEMTSWSTAKAWNQPADRVATRVVARG